MGILAGEGFDGVGADAGRLFPVSVQRMAGQIQTADLFFLLQQLSRGVLCQGADLVDVLLRAFLHFPAHHGEQIQLPLQIAAGVGLDAFKDALYRLHHTVAVGAKAVKGTGFDQAFHRAAVQLAAVQSLAEIVKAGVGPYKGTEYGYGRITQYRSREQSVGYAGPAGDNGSDGA